ncbi:hypothetical protein F0L68_40050 [Solihabitans fulvus]|uniref:OmpR/PhoB-type domain-containing protein n=1 Tax=Solihabitans fulvus TaxID=1892852 RepID=A0A5B2WB28_9PSEU|nr:hypothetical protein F0L68_40050 [Solihabitans fulvus]
MAVRFGRGFATLPVPAGDGGCAAVPVPHKLCRGRVVEFRILGPAEARGPDGRAGSLGAKQLALLTALLLNANRVVPVELLGEALWGDEPLRRSTGRVRVAGIARVGRGSRTPGPARGRQRATRGRRTTPAGLPDTARTRPLPDGRVCPHSGRARGRAPVPPAEVLSG